MEEENQKQKRQIKRMLRELGDKGLLVTSQQCKNVDRKVQWMIRYQIKGDSYLVKISNVNKNVAKMLARDNFANYVFYFRNEFTPFKQDELPPCHDPVLKNTIENFGQEDYMAKFHGGWTLETTNKYFYPLLQEILPDSNLALDVKYFGGNTIVSYSCIRKLQIKNNGQKVITITGQGFGDCKETCIMDFKMNVIRQLYHLGLVPSCNQTEIKTGKPEFTFEIKSKPAIIHQINIVLKPKEEEIKKPDPPPDLVRSSINWFPPNPPAGTNQALEAEIKEAKKNISQEIEKRRRNLPIYKRKQEIVDMIRERRIVVVQGSTGCGKSTQIPQFLLEDFLKRGEGAKFAAYITQPRRICAQSLARRVAQERGEKELGNTVGYAMRFDKQLPRKYGSICYLTAGYFLRLLRSGLHEISHLFIDEAHELDQDLEVLLTIARDMAEKYPKLRIIVMSATMNVASLQSYFGDCGFLQLQGNTAYDVESHYLEDIKSILEKAQMWDENDDIENNTSKKTDHNLEANFDTLPELDEDIANLSLENQANDKIQYNLIQTLVEYIDRHEGEGAILIFLPGWADIEELFWMLSESRALDPEEMMLLCLHSKLPKKNQRLVFEKVKGKRKIILSTNIAESSITIKDVVFVIDAGWARVVRFSPATNTNYFCTIHASKSNCLQRKGRAGRCQKGKYYLMVEKKKYDKFHEFNESALLNSTIDHVYLKVKALNLGSVEEFLSRAPNPPSRLRIVEAKCKLSEIGALDAQDRLTDLGQLLSEIPLEVELGSALILSRLFGVHDHVADIVCNTINTPWRLRISKNRAEERKIRQRIKSLKNLFKTKIPTPSDHEVMKAVAEKLSEMTPEKREPFLKKYALESGAMFEARRSKAQLLRILDPRRFKAKEDESKAKEGDRLTQMELKETDAALALGLLSRAFYPNTGVISKDSKDIRTVARDSPQINSISVVHANPAAANRLCFFNEKTQSRGKLYGQEISVISPIQLFLFTSRSVEQTSDDTEVIIGKTIRIKTEPRLARALIHLRKLMQDHLESRRSIPPEVIKLIESLLRLDWEMPPSPTS